MASHHPHVEEHFTATPTVRDVVAATNATRLVVTAGLAEIAAGSIAMGLGGYLAAKTDMEHYDTERQREIRETVELPEIETEEVAKVFRDYGLSNEQMAPVVNAIIS